MAITELVRLSGVLVALVAESGEGGTATVVTPDGEAHELPVTMAQARLLGPHFGRLVVLTGETPETFEEVVSELEPLEPDDDLGAAMQARRMVTARPIRVAGHSALRRLGRTMGEGK